MIYILFGEQELMIKNHINKILKDDFNNASIVVKMDLNEDSLGNVIDEFNQLSIIGDVKTIVVSEANFLSSQTGQKAKKIDENELNELIEAINSSENINSIIFTTTKNKLNDKNPLVKLVKKIGKIVEFKSVSKNEWPLFVKQYFAKRGINISQDAISELATRSQSNLSIFKNEATKLILYKGNNITYQDVLDLTSNVLEDDVFSILNNLILDNKKDAIKIYRDLKIQGVEPISLINLISSSIIYMLNVKNLANMHCNVDEIAKRTSSSTGRVYMTFKNLKKIDEIVLEEKLEELYHLDHDIKHSLVDRHYAFEMFLVNF